MPQTTAYMCEDCAERIPYSQTHVDNLGDRYHIDERTGNPHPIFEEIVQVGQFAEFSFDPTRSWLLPADTH